jgi:hypothetical protein
MSTIPCTRFVATAAAERLLMTFSSVLKLTSAAATTRSTWESIGDRTSVMIPGTPA